MVTKKAAGAKAAKRSKNVSTTGEDDPGFTDGPTNPNIRLSAETGEEISSNGDEVAQKRKAKHARAITADLPGMEDRKIVSLHKSALEYVQKRDERMGVLAEEKLLKDKLLGLMHKHDRKSYNCEGVIIEIVPEGEKLVVKAPKKLDDDEE